MLPFVELHRHGDRSHDGSGKPEWAIKYAKELGQNSLALTDHGNINGLVDHYNICVQDGIKPILGCEIYFQPQFRKTGDATDYDSDGEIAIADHDVIDSWQTSDRYHLTVLCESADGYKNLCRILTEANATSFYRVPIVTLALLEKYRGGLVFLTGCLSGFVGQHIVAGDLDTAWKMVGTLCSLSTENTTYLEVQPFMAPEQDTINRQLCVWADLYDLPLVMTSDAHFVRPEHYDSHLMMQKIRKPYQDGFLADFSVRHIHSGEEMLTAWNEYMGGDVHGKEAIQNTQVIADRCDVNFTKQFTMPDMSWLTNTPKKELIKRVRDGLLALGFYEEVVENGKKKKRLLQPYKERVALEMERMDEKGFVPYILLCADIAAYCKSQDIYAQARGSACGSEVCHALGISKVDTLTYQTSFDRFISAASVKFPDIDFDIQDDRKQEVVDYVIDRYPGAAAQICTFGSFKKKSVVNGLIKAASLDIIDAEEFRSEMADIPDMELSAKELRQWCIKSAGLLDLETRHHLVQHYHYIYGQTSFRGKHAAGVAIAYGALSDQMSVDRVGSGTDIKYVTSYPMDNLDDLGVLKVDLLGVSALTGLKEVLEEVDVTLTDPMIEMMFNSSDVLEAFAQADTLGIFQSERGAKKLYRKIKPSNWHDLAIVNACDRPLPIQEGTFDMVLAGKAGKTAHQFYSDVCRETYGAIVYQEQVMAICKELAGFDDAQVDRVLKLLKKYHENDADLEADFVGGIMLGTSITEYEAKDLWQSMRRYLFTKSHAVAYSMIAALQMYLKINYPAQFYCALLKNEGDKDKRRVYAADALRHGVKILTPHVNGGADYQLVTIGNTTFIQEGLINLPNIGPATAQAIERERSKNGPYQDSVDFTNRYHGDAKIAILERFNALAFGKKYQDGVIDYQLVLQSTRTYI